MKQNSDRPIAKIVTVLTGKPDDEVTLATAFAAARPFGAHVRAIFAESSPDKWIPGIGMAASPESFEQIMETARQLRGLAGKSAKQSLAIEAERCNVLLVAHARCEPGGTAAYASLSGPLADCMLREAPTCDLFVLPPVGDANADLRNTFADLLIKIGRPLLLSPQQAPQGLGRRIAIAWDNSLPAGHALSAALPFLSRAKWVEIVTVERRGANQTLDPAKEYLALHDIACSERVVEQGDLSVADAILKQAFEAECDLLVVGGYSHGRVRETIFGGVTERLTSHATIPLLMMH